MSDSVGCEAKEGLPTVEEGKAKKLKDLKEWYILLKQNFRGRKRHLQPVQKHLRHRYDLNMEVFSPHNLY